MAPDRHVMVGEGEGPVRPLDRYLSPLDVWGMAFGCMVGWGVFAMPGSTFLPIAGPAGTLISLLIGMVIMLIIARSITFFMSRTSITGSMYSYIKEAFGRGVAFLGSWFLCLSYLTIVFLNGTAVFFVIRTIFDGVLLGSPQYVIAGTPVYLWETIASLLVLACIGILFIVAKPVLQKIQTFLAIVLFMGIVAITVVCLPSAISSGALTSFGFSEIRIGHAIFSLIILAPWAFVGFEVVAFDTAHFKFDIRKSRAVLVVAIVAATLAYCSMAIVGVAAVPDGFSSWQDYLGNLDSLSGPASVPTFFAAKSTFGTAGLVVMAITAMAAILTGIIGGYRATTRVLSTMAEERILSERFNKTTYSILFIMGLSFLFAILGRSTLNWFVDLTSFGAIVGFGCTAAAAFKIGKAEGDNTAKVFGALGLAISCVLVIVQLVPGIAAMEAMSGAAFLALAFWCLLGFVFYWQTVSRGTMTGLSGMSASGAVLFALLVYCSLMWMGKLLTGCETIQEMQEYLVWGGLVLIVLIFSGLVVMMHVLRILRSKHEAIERERIHAVESSLAKSQFLFNMSHDIRTPMNAIIGYTNLAMDEPDHEVAKEYLQKIKGSSEHLLALINDILEMSRIESGKVELEFVPVDLRSVFDGIHELFAEQMSQKNLDFQVHANQVQNRYVWCDKKNLNRVLLNILSNAYKFTPEGGAIIASLMESGSTEYGYGSYEIRIQDTGIGMSHEFVEKMFHAFERERTSTVSGIEGTGLGLSITKSIVDMMGGTIEVLTAPGAGTEIVIHLKFQIAKEEDVASEEQYAAAADEEPSASGPEIDFSKLRVLLVEDNAINAEIATMILTQVGFTVELVENGQLAVDAVSASDPGYFDAVLMDIQMPVMDGYEATRQIRALDNEELASIPIVAMTANAFNEDKQAALDAGMQAHIAKPVDVGVMIKTLTEVLKEAQMHKTGSDE